jgi:hypothetical protein
MAEVSAGTDLTYQWDLGDGASAEGAIVSHIYALPGVYDVSLTVGNELGSASATATVEIEAPTSVELAKFGEAPPSNFWGFYTLGVLVISIACLTGLAIMWRRGLLFPSRER